MLVTAKGGSFRNYDSVTPSDTDRYPVAQALYVGTGGVVVLVREDGKTVSVTAADGATLFMTSIGVNATDTTASGIIRMY